MPIAHLTLASRDVDAAQRFFAEALEWRPIEKPNNIAMKAAWLDIGGGQELHLLEDESFEPSAFEREYGRHVAVSFPLDLFASLKERLRRAGAELIAPKRPTSFERFFFRSPDGYVFEVVPS
jgi:catechol 2,3-dioxygenase-like lactoylglutathione lyase family enzyme